MPASSSEPGYDTKQETIALLGLPDIQIRSLLDKQQFHDPLEAALRLGISSAAWPLFGLLWPSGRRLAERLGQRPVATGERILEIGCGLALSSLVGHRRGADMTASDCHPLAAAFLRENLRLNALLPMKYWHGQWGGLAPADDLGSTPGPDRLLHGRYDLIISNPPYVDGRGMAKLPPEYRHEPRMALAAGDDGLDLVRRILAEAPRHLTKNGNLLCEIGRGRRPLETAYPRLPFLWLDTEQSEGEVFWIARKDLA